MAIKLFFAPCEIDYFLELGGGGVSHPSTPLPVIFAPGSVKEWVRQATARPSLSPRLRYPGESFHNVVKHRCKFCHLSANLLVIGGFCPHPPS